MDPRGHGWGRSSRAFVKRGSFWAVRREHLGSWCGWLFLAPPKSKAISPCPAGLPLGLRKWMQGHLGTPEGLEIPAGSHHPGSSPQSTVPRLPAIAEGRGQVGSHREGGWRGLSREQHGSPDPLPSSTRPASGPGGGSVGWRSLPGSSCKPGPGGAWEHPHWLLRFLPSSSHSPDLPSPMPLGPREPGSGSLPKKPSMWPWSSGTGLETLLGGPHGGVRLEPKDLGIETT